jgi:hypothetical protein
MTATTAIPSPFGPLSLSRVRALRVPRIAKRTAAPSRFDEYVIDVDFETPDGEKAFAIGGGATFEEAVLVALQSLPADRVWLVVRWNHVHGT